MDIFNLSMLDLYRVLLVFFRIGALMMTVPVFGHISIPRLLRLWLVIMMSVFLVPVATVAGGTVPPSAPHLVMVILSELAIGILMGFAVIIVFSAVQFAGHIIGLQMGLAVANVFDPMSAGQISIIGEFYYLLSLVLLFILQGHHFIILSLAHSFEVIPVGAATFGPAVFDFFVDLSFMIFVVGIRLAAPVIITLFIMNSILGIVSRTVPQMNVFIVGFPLAIGVGLALIAVSMPHFYSVLSGFFGVLERNMAELVAMLAP